MSFSVSARLNREPEMKLDSVVVIFLTVFVSAASYIGYC